MIRTLCCAIVVVAACAHHPASNSQTSPRSRSITGRIVYVDSATMDSIRRANPPDSGMVAFARRYDSLAALVDTIVVLSPDSIVLHVGQAVEMLDLIRTEARRASGEIVSTYPGFMEVEDPSVAQTQEAGLTGLRVGRTRVVLTVANRNAHAPPSYVPVIVLP
jgi:hypothetical protein